MKSFKRFLKSDLARIISGAVFFVPAIILEHLELSVPALVLYILALVIAGAKVFYDAIRGILRRDLLDEKFLMSVASIGAMIVGEWSEGVAVMLFFLVGETFEHMAVRRSRNSIRSLMDICPDEACLLTEEGEETVDAEDVEVGSTIIIRPGERVPIDCVIISGSANIDTSAMTGEAIPARASAGDSLDSGVVVIDGLLTCRTLRPSGESAAARVLELVENASENKSKEENFITKFSHYYTPTVVVAAILLAIIPAIFKIAALDTSVYRALIFLVTSCPCALVISVPMAFFGGIGGAASRGVLFKGGNVFSKVASADTVAFDKTGTVTGGKFSVAEIMPIGIEKSELLYLAASAEYASNHPIAISIKSASKASCAPDSAVEIAGEGIIAQVNGASVAVGNSALMSRVGAKIYDPLAGAVYVAKDGELVGAIIISDEIKPEAKSAVSELSRLGVNRTAILSGDRRENVERVATAVGISEFYSELTPEQKYKKLEELLDSAGGGVMYAGDGINDAPALARADIGIAMGSLGQDSAIEAADVVIMTDNLSKIPEAVLIARKTIAIAKQNIVFALGIKALILLFGALGFADMWLAVFADVGVAALAILNSMRALRFSKRKKN